MRSVPAETVLWRLSLLREFEIDEEKLSRLTQPVLLIAGGSDRLLPSVTEVKRIANILPNNKIVVLPHCGHACLLEQDINLYKILKDNDFLERKVDVSRVQK
jgi:pimeloyl-ACP methyl ester carboxylesterase